MQNNASIINFCGGHYDIKQENGIFAFTAHINYPKTETADAAKAAEAEEALTS